MEYQSIRVVRPESSMLRPLRHPDRFVWPLSIREPALNRLFGEAYSESNRKPGRESITMESKTRSSMSSAALHTFAGASEGSLTRRRNQGISFMSPLGFRIRRSILPAKCLFNGLSFAALPNRLL